MAMVVQANRQSSEYGGHISTYASAATLYEVGFNHFWRAPMTIMRRHGVCAGPFVAGIYARAYLEGRLTRTSCAAFARKSEVAGCLRIRTLADAGFLAVPDGVDGLGR